MTKSRIHLKPFYAQLKLYLNWHCPACFMARVMLVSAGCSFCLNREEGKKGRSCHTCGWWCHQRKQLRGTRADCQAHFHFRKEHLSVADIGEIQQLQAAFFLKFLTHLFPLLHPSFLCLSSCVHTASYRSQHGPYPAVFSSWKCCDMLGKSSMVQLMLIKLLNIQHFKGVHRHLKPKRFQF